MTPIKTPDCNFTYTAPSGMKECRELPCLRQEACTTSFWLPTSAELVHLAAGGTVAFTHYGKGHPVVGLGVMPAADDEKHTVNPNDAEWQQGFASAIGREMNRHGIQRMVLELRDEGTVRYEMEPEEEKQKAES